MKITGFTPFDTSLYEHGQSAILALLGRLRKGVRVRITVRRNAYDDQSSARIEAFHQESLSWHELFVLPGAEMQTCENFTYSQGCTDDYPEKARVDLDDFADDVNYLVRMAYEILGEYIAGTREETTK